MFVTKENGEREPFDPRKLIQSLDRSGASEQAVQEVLRHVSAELSDGVSTREIYGKAFSLLRGMEAPVAARYSMKRAVLELGPSGFPFEDFIGEIFKAKGFRVETGVMINGLCVEHEVDLVASNDHQYLLGEAKFHNELGLKSDLKVALYVEARIEDIQALRAKNGEKIEAEGWLITNTKFTKSVVSYASCKGLKIVSWNYPRYGNLHDLIEETGVHPLTCLTTLSGQQKSSLLGQGIVLCKSIQSDTEKLKFVGVTGEHLQKVLDESRRLCVPHV